MLETIKTIVADEDNSCGALSGMIRDYIPVINLVACCTSIQLAHMAIMNHLPDLVMLGTELEGDKGFTLLRMWKELPFKCVILSGVPFHAVEAFRFSAVDYLLKPVHPGELKQAVEKVQHALTVSRHMEESVILEIKSLRQKKLNDNLVIFNTTGFTVVKPEEVILCEAEGYCTNFYLVGGNKVHSSHNLKHYETTLPGNKFRRVHNSFIINMDHVKGYTFQGEVLLSENLKCTVSKVQRKAFLAVFGKIGKSAGKTDYG
jgi:two-component system, LytTR family, response regulator